MLYCKRSVALKCNDTHLRTSKHMSMAKRSRHDRIKQRFLAAHDELADDIFAFCHARTSNREVALDVTQDIFLNVWDYLASGKTVQHLRAFIYRTARNKIVDYYRKHKSSSLDMAREFGFDLSDSGYAVAYATTQADADFTMRAMEALSPQHYQIIQMRYVDQLSLDEIAFQYGETKNTISVRLHRALAQARKHLDTHSQT